MPRVRRRRLLAAVRATGSSFQADSADGFAKLVPNHFLVIGRGGQPRPHCGAEVLLVCAEIFPRPWRPNSELHLIQSSPALAMPPQKKHKKGGGSPGELFE